MNTDEVDESDSNDMCYFSDIRKSVASVELVSSRGGDRYNFISCVYLLYLELRNCRNLFYIAEL